MRACMQIHVQGRLIGTALGKVLPHRPNRQEYSTSSQRVNNVESPRMLSSHKSILPHLKDQITFYDSYIFIASSDKFHYLIRVTYCKLKHAGVPLCA